MRVENNHAHAYTRYSLLGFIDYWLLFRSIIETKIYGYPTLTTHLPFEIQHRQVLNLGKAYSFIRFGETLRKIFKVNLCWENAPWLNFGKWNLKYGNTLWQYIPTNINLCLDTGHLMLGAKNKDTFNKRLQKVLKKRGIQIRHLHLHENNFQKDQHLPVPGKVIAQSLFRKLIKNRTYIVEHGEDI